MAGAPIINEQAVSPGQTIAKTPAFLVALVVGLFFIWGGLTSLNDILIPKLKDLFRLSFAEAMMIQFAFFTAYAVVSIPAGAAVHRLGYGRGIVLGLAIMAVGCLLFIPAAQTATYAFFLGALFILASGVATLQVAANPLIAQMGDSHSSHSRLTLAQAFNALGTTVWPLVGAQIILGSISDVDPSSLEGAELAAFQSAEVAVVSRTYFFIVLALALLAVPFVIWREKLGAIGAQRFSSKGLGLDLLKRARLGLGVMSIFLYVGAEVSIGSIIVNYLMQPDVLAADERTAGSMVSLYWGGAMVGRFIGAGVLRLAPPGVVLCAAALLAAALATVSMLSTGHVSAYCLLAIGLANAIMFPTIFSLALEGLGLRAAQGSGLLCVAIVGGAIVPLLMGMLADATSLATSIALPVICYLGIAFYGWSARQPAAPLDATSPQASN